MEVSVVIVCMNRPDNLYPCLRSVFQHTSVSFECLVVAYLYDKQALAQARKDFPEARFIASDSIRGFSENNNLALKESKGKYCFVLNDDTEFHGDVIGGLVADFEKLPPDAAIVSPKLLNADGSLQLCGRPPYPPHKFVLHQWHLYKEPIDSTLGKTPCADRLFRSWNITGAAFMIRRDVFESLGWFDERYFFTPEDIALGSLACGKGYSLWVDASLEIVHKWRTTATPMSRVVRPAAMKGNVIYFGGRSRAPRLLKVCVWCSEAFKYLLNAVRCLFNPSPANVQARETYRNITRELLGPLSPKEIFVKYYTGFISQSE